MLPRGTYRRRAPTVNTWSDGIISRVSGTYQELRFAGLDKGGHKLKSLGMIAGDGERWHHCAAAASLLIELAPLTTVTSLLSAC
jgi:hypothetical protein